MSITTRDRTIDIMKGLLILMMVIGHTDSIFTPTIYLFHMAAFIMVSGYLYTDRYSVKTYILKQFKGCIVPFFIVNIFFIIMAKILNFGFKETIFQNIPSLTNLFKYLHTVDIGGASWFLIVLFYSSILSAVLIKLNNKIDMKITTVLILLINILLQVNKIQFPYYLDLSFFGAFFFLMGYITKVENLLKEREIDFIFILCLIIIIYFRKFNYIGMNWPTRKFNMPLNILPICASSYCLFQISKMFSKNEKVSNFFILLGQATLGIMFFHFLGFRLSYIFLWKIGKVEKVQISQLVLDSKYDFWYFVVLLGVFFSLFMEEVLALKEKIYIGFFGRKKSQESFFRQNLNLKKTIFIVIGIILLFNVEKINKNDFLILENYEFIKKSPPKIVTLNPERISEGKIFNEYYSQAVLIVYGKSFSRKSVVIMNGQKLDTTLGNDFLTAIVPKELYEKASKLEIYVEEIRGKKRVNSNVKEIWVEKEKSI